MKYIFQYGINIVIYIVIYLYFSIFQGQQKFQKHGNQLNPINH